MSKYGVPFLDASIYKDPSFRETGRLDHSPFVKPAARHVPLSGRSSHPASVYRSWPVAEMCRLKRLRLHSTVFEYHRARKVNRFRAFYLDRAILTRCLQYRSRVVRESRDKDPFEQLLRFVVWFHPGLRGLCSELNSVCRMWSPMIYAIVGRDISFGAQVSFTCAGPPLHVVARRGFF